MRPRNRSQVDDHAACRSLNPVLWFSSTKFSERRAKAICKGCPALEPCRADALRVTRALSEAGRLGEDEGIFGGLTPGERASLVGERHSTVGRMRGDDDDE